MTTLPNLTPCPKPDCRAPITHWHDDFGNVFACYVAMRGEPCTHDDIRCHAPREAAPLHLPDVDTVARAVYESDDALPEWDDEREGVKDAYRAYARAALDLIAERVPVWKRVEPGTLIKAGTRFRVESPSGLGTERVASYDRTVDDSAPVFIDPRTVPAEPEDPRLAVVVEWSNEPAADTREEAARDLLARLDALEADR